MKNSRKQSASLLGIVVVFGLFIVVGLAVSGAVTNAEWRGSSGVPSIEAVGSITSKADAEAPNGPKGSERVYLKVDFLTDDGTIFVIPLRRHDLEAIPVSMPETTGGGWYSCSGDGRCQQGGGPVVTRKVPAQLSHGILRYHQCDGDFYCFDSFKETPAPKKN
jgi:hypothetical protein